jgi:hypothetical protein
MITRRIAAAPAALPAMPTLHHGTAWITGAAGACSVSPARTAAAAAYSASAVRARRVQLSRLRPVCDTMRARASGRLQTDRKRWGSMQPARPGGLSARRRRPDVRRSRRMCCGAPWDKAGRCEWRLGLRCCPSVLLGFPAARPARPACQGPGEAPSVKARSCGECWSEPVSPTHHCRVTHCHDD